MCSSSVVDLIVNYLSIYVQLILTLAKSLSTLLSYNKLLTSMRIHLVVNISWIVWYKEQVGGQKNEEGKLIEVEKV